MLTIHFIFDAGQKKVPRPHQYFGVKAAQQRIRQREGGVHLAYSRQRQEHHHGTDRQMADGTVPRCMTTSDFTSGAVKEADQTDKTRIALMNGE